MGATERKRYEKIRRNRMQAHGVRRKRKTRRKPAPCLGLCYGIRGVRCPYIERDNQQGVQPVCETKIKFKMNSKETWKYIIQTIVAILTAILTTLGVTSCMGMC